MRLIDADKIVLGNFSSVDDFYRHIEYEPTVDAVEVVRCKDCKYNVLGECAVTNMIHQDESFCSWGVEK